MMMCISSGIKNLKIQKEKEKGMHSVYMNIYYCLVRWDLQRARTLIQHQYLLDRYKRIHEKTLKPTNQKPTKPSIDTFLPKPEKSTHRIINCHVLYLVLF